MQERCTRCRREFAPAEIVQLTVDGAQLCETCVAGQQATSTVKRPEARDDGR